jgi:hypothetical protein
MGLTRKGFEVFMEAFTGSKSGFFRDRFHLRDVLLEQAHGGWAAGDF